MIHCKDTKEFIVLQELLGLFFYFVVISKIIRNFATFSKKISIHHEEFF